MAKLIKFLIDKYLYDTVLVITPHTDGIRVLKH